MAKTVLNLLITFDGFIAGEKDEIDWIDKVHKRNSGGGDFDFSSFTSKVGAIITGNRSYKLGIEHGWFKNNAYGPSPVFVLCKDVPEKKSGDADFRYVTNGIQEAYEQASKTAGEKWIYLFGGADVFQQFINEDLVEEMHITFAPILIGKGIRLFDNLTEQHIELDIYEVNHHPSGMVETKLKIIRS
ncbi:MAG: dihydrofolate reductase family protein [Ignavibacteriaceae bacterium]